MNNYLKNKEVTQLLRSLLRYNQKNGKCINAFQVIYNSDILKVAYETIKSNSGNMVRGTDKETLDGINND
jgi:hypothetical protein